MIVHIVSTMSWYFPRIWLSSRLAVAVANASRCVEIVAILAIVGRDLSQCIEAWLAGISFNLIAIDNLVCLKIWILHITLPGLNPRASQAVLRHGLDVTTAYPLNERLRQGDFTRPALAISHARGLTYGDNLRLKREIVKKVKATEGRGPLSDLLTIS